MATTMRRCSGSTTFGIETHEAPASDFPIQPSRKDGLGTMCKPHWNQYTSALRKAALARKAAEGGVTVDSPATPARVSNQQRRAAAGKVPAADGSVPACSKTVGKRTCVAGAEGHAGPHDWPKTATAKAPRRSKVEHPMAHIPPAGAATRRKARAIIAATDRLGGKAYTDAIGSNEVQAALEGGGQEDTFEQDVRAILAEA